MKPADAWSFIVAALVVVTMVLASTGCSTTSGAGEAGQDRRPDQTRSRPSFYPATVSDICAATDEQLAELPVPGEEIAETDWAGEVARVIASEADSLEDVGIESAMSATITGRSS